MARYLCFVWMLRIAGCGAEVFCGIGAQARCRRIVHIGRLFQLSACGYAVAEISRAPTAAGCGRNCTGRTRRLLESRRLERSVLLGRLDAETAKLWSAVQDRGLHAADGCGRAKPVCW